MRTFWFRHRHAFAAISSRVGIASVQKHTYTEGLKAREIPRKLGALAFEEEPVVIAKFGRCPICRELRRLVRDHDHRTGLERGEICGSCNSALGFLYDDPLIARMAGRYLRKGGAQPYAHEADADGKPSTPAKPRRKRRLPKTISRVEAEALLAVPNLNAPTGLRNRCMLELMYRAGLRVGEVVALAPRDVDGPRGMVRVEDGKGGDGTAYFDTGSVAPLLDEWRRERKRLGFAPNVLFCTLAGGPVSTTYMRAMVKRYARRAGLDPRKVTPHVLRHSFATELLDEGFNIRKVQEACRHADVSTTMIYTHVLDSDLRRDIQRRKR